jgi:hypothetical protein
MISMPSSRSSKLKSLLVPGGEMLFKAMQSALGMFGMTSPERPCDCRTVTSSGCCSAGPKVGRSSCDCTIPPPPWLPYHVADVVSCVCPGGVATLRLDLRNAGFHPHAYDVEVTPEREKDDAVLDPAHQNLGPLECGKALVRVTVPKDATIGSTIHRVVWVQGCRRHYVDWCIQVGACSTSSCHEVRVDDEQDYVHHWYDHFYCEHPCLGRANDRG